MTFRASQVRYERFNEDGTFALTDEGGGSCADGFSTRNLHRPEKEFGELYNDPLQDTVVIKELDTGDEEDYRGDNCRKEPAYRSTC
jgi:hypothetical protein